MRSEFRYDSVQFGDDEPFLKTGKDSEGDLDNVAYSRSALDCRQLHCQAHQSEGQSKEA